LNKNIPATLDLAQSVQTFQESVAKALVLTNVSEWDGRILKQRVGQIRQAALILAGQCIALLLHSLAQFREAHATAATQTQGWRFPASTADGKRRVQVLTLGNVAVPLWLPYVVERFPSRSRVKEGNTKRLKDRGFTCF